MFDGNSFQDCRMDMNSRFEFRRRRTRKKVCESRQTIDILPLLRYRDLLAGGRSTGYPSIPLALAMSLGYRRSCLEQQLHTFPQFKDTIASKDIRKCNRAKSYDY